MDLKKLLKKKLWECFGEKNFPAEWDGNIYGGGKLSQRFWEYFCVLEYLALEKDSVLLDIGGGSPTQGYGFFASVVNESIGKTIVLDPAAGHPENLSKKMEIVTEAASYDSLSKIFLENKVSHVSCISVFEHIPHRLRCGIVQAIDEHFHGKCFVATYEYHPTKTFFDEQLTTKSASELFSVFKRHFLTEYSRSPTLCENAISNHIPLWYPVAVKFENGAATSPHESD